MQPGAIRRRDDPAVPLFPEEERRMNRAWRIVGWIILVLVLLVIAAGAALWFGGTPALAWAVKHPVSSLLGRQISIDGPLRLRWGNPTEILAEEVHVANAPWGSEPDMFQAKRLVVDIYMRTLIFGPTRIPRIELDDAKLVLETSKNGDKNWNFGASAAAPKKRHQFPDLRRLIVQNSMLTYRNGVTGAVSELGIASLDLSEPNPSEPLTVTARGTFQKAPLRLAGTVGPIAELRDTSKPYPLKLEGDLDQIKLVAEGGIAEPLDFDGVDLRLSLSGAKLHELADMLGVPLPPLPDFRGTAELTGGDAAFSLKAISLKAGNSDLQGGIDIDASKKVPELKANLTSSYVDLADFTGLGGAKPQTSSAPAKPADPSGRVLPDSKIAVEKLPGVNAELSFFGRRVKSTGGLPLEHVALGVQLKDGELTVDPFRIHAAHGDVALKYHFTPFTRNSPPKMHAEVDVRHVDLHELLDRPSMPEIMQQTAGVVGGFVKIDTTGVSTREFLAHMNGDAGFFMQNGQVSQLLDRLAPIDVLGALGVYAFGGTPVPINCLVSRFDIKSGIATATTLLFDTSGTVVTGEGNLNFADETITLRLVPRNKSFTIVSLRTPVDIGGTFAKPDFRLEKGNLIARLGAAVGLGVLMPPAALLPLIDTGLGEQNACHQAYSAQNPPGNPVPKSGSSTPPERQR